MNINIPTPLRAYTGGLQTVTVPGATVGKALQALVAAYPDLNQHLYTGEGKLRSFVNLYLNDDDIRYLPQKEASPVADSDELSIIPSIAGGF
jgi:adenylyltransferase/sulfurtransferase